jgi:hypothetical protein
VAPILEALAAFSLAPPAFAAAIPAIALPLAVATAAVALLIVVVACKRSAASRARGFAGGVRRGNEIDADDCRLNVCAEAVCRGEVQRLRQARGKLAGAGVGVSNGERERPAGGGAFNGRVGGLVEEVRKPLTSISAAGRLRWSAAMETTAAAVFAKS